MILQVYLKMMVSSIPVLVRFKGEQRTSQANQQCLYCMEGHDKVVFVDLVSLPGGSKTPVISGGTWGPYK